VGSREIPGYEPSDEGWTISLGPFMQPPPEPEEQRTDDVDEHDVDEHPAS
jgi:hypothetical protein